MWVHGVTWGDMEGQKACFRDYEADFGNSQPLAEKVVVDDYDQCLQGSDGWLPD